MTTDLARAEFAGVTLDLIHRNGQIWLTAEQIGDALGLRHARISVNKIFRRHADEFTEAETCETSLVTQDQRRELRLFSPDGARLIAFFAQTDRAKAFRRWVLEVLKRETLPAASEAEVARLRAALLDARPDWAKITRYRHMGLNRNEIARLMACGEKKIRIAESKMSACGMLPQRTASQLSLLEG